MSPNVEQWLAEIAENTARQAELLERRQANEEQNRRREDSYIEKLGKRIEQGVTSQLSYRLNQAQSIANRGFSGTVEQARMDYAMEQLGRQFAAVMKPVMDALTYGAAQIELRMRMMGSGAQNALLGTGVGAVAGRAIGSMMGYGNLGMFLGGAVGNLAGGNGWGDNSVFYGAGIGAGIGGRFGGVPGGVIGATIGAATAPLTSGDYGRLRKEGNSRLASAAGSTIASIYDFGYGLFGGDAKDSVTNKARAEHAAKFGGKAESRRDVTPYQADMMEAGGAYFAMQKGVILATTGAGFEEQGPFTDLMKLLLKMFDALMMIAAPGYKPPTTAEAAARTT